MQNVYFFYNFDPSGAHTLSVLSSSNDFEVLGLTDSGDWDGYLYFYSTEIKDGITIIEIYVNFATPAEMWVQAIFVFIVGGIIVGVYYYLKHNEKKLEKVRSFVQEKIIDKISKEKEQKGYSELKIQIKDNKILLEVPKDKKS